MKIHTNRNYCISYQEYIISESVCYVLLLIQTCFSFCTYVVGEDYTVEDTGVLHFDNTTTRINILVTIVDDDVFEPKEDFIIQLSTSDNNIHFEQSSATITILNDDPNVEMRMLCLHQ